MDHALTGARRAAAAAAAALIWAGLLVGSAGCTAPGPDGRPPVPAGADPVKSGGSPAASGGAVRVTPADGSRGVRADAPLEVRAGSGRLESVEVTGVRDAQEFSVAGRLSPDGRTWRPSGGRRLALAARYTVDAVAVDARGRRTARHATFSTYVPAQRFIAYVKPENRATVGTGMIVSLEFSRYVRDRAAVERAIRVRSRPPVEIRPHWFGGNRLDFRPETYWRPGTRVTVDLRLLDVEAAPGVHGLQDRTFAFTVGRHQVSRVDAAAHTMRVERDGRLLATLPVTAGAPGTETYNGRMVVTEMLEVTRMNGATVGFRGPDGKGEYDIPDVPHALRLTTSGTFLHGNYWAPDAFGRANVSHGCIGLRDVKGGGPDTPAGWFFDRTLVGDVVEVVGSRDRVVAPDNGLGGWNMGWKQWKAGGAAR